MTSQSININSEVDRFMNSKIKILVLAVNPVNTSQLRLDEEVRSIQEELVSVRSIVG